MDKRKTAEIILQSIDDYAPVQVDWNNKKWWVDAIVEGLKKAETPGAATPRESK